MVKKIIAILSLALALPLAARQKSVPFSVIPEPREVVLNGGSFRLAGAAFGIDPSLDEPCSALADSFRRQIELVSGRKSATVEGSAPGKGISFIRDAALAPEAYTLDIAKHGVIVKASGYNGFLYAIQTIRQMLPTDIYGQSRTGDKLRLPCARISDAPRFGYRGLLLDSCRHFWETDEVKRVLDIMAMHKLNRLHWHLTEDQGWRIESVRYPRLNTIGSQRQGTQVAYDFQKDDGIPYGGYYTRDELREIVAYAADLGITIIPEIDMPGHMVAALAAYPELGCTKGPYETRRFWGIADDILCPGKSATFEFLKGVFDELLEIFPSEYINIGGDEAPKKRWKECPDCQKLISELGLEDRDGFTKEQYLQNYVTKYMQDYLASKGRRIIGWDEILEGELAPGATVMSWRGTAGGIKGASLGFDVIMSPNSYLYIDYSNSKELDKEPIGIGRRYNDLRRVYGYEPFEGMPESARSHILGVQANVWTEYIASPEHLEYMLLPRLSALSEVQWCSGEARDYGRFLGSMEHMKAIYEKLGYTYCRYTWGVAGMPGHEQDPRSAEELEKLDVGKLTRNTYDK